jgi:hypothetical protein
MNVPLLEDRDQRRLKAECKLSGTDHSKSLLFPRKTSEHGCGRSGKPRELLPVEVHRVLTRWLGTHPNFVPDFLEPWLMDFYTTVIIPFDDRVILVRPLDRTHFTSRHSEVAQTFDPITEN